MTFTIFQYYFEHKSICFNFMLNMYNIAKTSNKIRQFGTKVLGSGGVIAQTILKKSSTTISKVVQSFHPRGREVKVCLEVTKIVSD